MTFAVAGNLTVPAPQCILADLQSFAGASSANLATFVGLFPETPPLSESDFEKALWRQLGALSEADREHFVPDPAISTDPRSPDFALSVGGTGFFVVGMHPNASRIARRAPIVALAFNRHDQFRDLKASGQYERMRNVIRKRDIALQGDTNPMLAEHGNRSEAPQYSGRDVPDDWVCPYTAGQHAA